MLYCLWVSQVSNFALPKLSEEEALLNKLVLIHQGDIADPLPQVL